MNRFSRFFGAKAKDQKDDAKIEAKIEAKIDPNIQLIPTDKATNNVLISAPNNKSELVLQTTGQPVAQVASPPIRQSVSQADQPNTVQSDVQSYLQSRNQGNSQQNQVAPAVQVAQVVQTAPVGQAAQNGHTSQPLIRLENVNKAYQTPVGEFIALRGINLTIGTGEFVAVVGKSGSGKSTLINMITGIDRPTTGEIFVGDSAIHNLAEGPMAEWRGRNIGIIFQFFQLLPMLSCIENVMLPMDFCNMYKASEREARALHLLEQVDMVEHAYKLPSEVSGGQQQRVAIARALANDPPLLVADEPTGNLDSRTAEAVFQLFARMVDEGKTILMVTHDDEMAHQVRRTITLTDGQIVNQDYYTQHAHLPTLGAHTETQTPVADQPIMSI